VLIRIHTNIPVVFSGPVSFILKINVKHMRFEVLTAVNMTMVVWIVTPRGLVGGY
jgi:hypothetical protein